MKATLLLMTTAVLLVSVSILAGSSYIDYSESTYKENASSKRVLFFHASWCGACKSADKDFKQKSSELNKGIVVLKVDFDTEKELKKKYNISSQHTFVQVDAKGKLVAKWSGGSVEKVNSKVK